MWGCDPAPWRLPLPAAGQEAAQAERTVLTAGGFSPPGRRVPVQGRPTCSDTALPGPWTGQQGSELTTGLVRKAVGPGDGRRVVGGTRLGRMGAGGWAELSSRARRVRREGGARGTAVPAAGLGPLPPRVLRRPGSHRGPSSVPQEWPQPGSQGRRGSSRTTWALRPPQWLPRHQGLPAPGPL